mgnify:CR=1 FL=1
MTWVRRIPKRGFTNAPFKTRFHVVNLRDLEARFEKGAEIDATSLAEAGLIRDARLPLKVRGEGMGIGGSVSGIIGREEETLRVAGGERVGLIGAHGAGKVTLFNCIVGRLRMDGGSVSVNGVDLGSMPMCRATVSM